MKIPLLSSGCPSCGIAWSKHKDISHTCRDLQSVRKQLINLRVMFFVLCLKYLPPEKEFTEENLLMVLNRSGQHAR